MRRLTLASCVALVLLVAGCGSEPGPQSDPTMNRLQGTAWSLSLIQLPSRQRLPVDTPGAYRIHFAEADRFVVTSGSDQCVGLYNSSGRALTVRLDCPLASRFPPGSVGKEFLVILSTATHFGMTSSGAEMYIDSTASGASLSFQRVQIPPPPASTPGG